MKIEELLEEREKTHGSFATHAFYTQKLKDVMGLHLIFLSRTQKEALEMIVHKIGRILAGNPNHIDHWDDIAGYATLVTMELRKKEKEEDNGHAPTETKKRD